MSNPSDYYHLRRFLAVLCFLSAFGCLIAFFSTGSQHYILLVIMVILFISTYFIAPYSQGRRSWKSDVAQEVLLDQWFIEGFFHIFVFLIRIVISFVRHIVN